MSVNLTSDVLLPDLKTFHCADHYLPKQRRAAGRKDALSRVKNDKAVAERVAAAESVRLEARLNLVHE
jgi:hypothetical protein